jgi:hypothetical protein
MDNIIRIQAPAVFELAMINCNHCHQHFYVDTAHVSDELACPHCQQVEVYPTYSILGVPTMEEYGVTALDLQVGYIEGDSFHNGQNILSFFEEETVA